MSEQQSGKIDINVQWNFNPASVPVPSNNLMIVEGAGVGNGTAGTFELHFGHVSAPPIFAETEEEARQIAESVSSFVNSVGHFTVTVDALRQMQETVNEALRKYDASRS